LANQLVDHLTVRMPPFYTQTFHTMIADSGIIFVPSRGDNQCSDTFHQRNNYVMYIVAMPCDLTSVDFGNLDGCSVV